MLKFATPCLILALAMPVYADEPASAEDLREINEELADLNCGPVDEAEQETADLFELDDVPCKAHQYDIKLSKIDGAHTVISMTYDGPLEGDAGARARGCR